jgi:hypothetical protein
MFTPTAEICVVFTLVCDYCESAMFPRAACPVSITLQPIFPGTGRFFWDGQMERSRFSRARHYRGYLAQHESHWHCLLTVVSLSTSITAQYLSLFCFSIRLCVTSRTSVSVPSDTAGSLGSVDRSKHAGGAVPPTRQGPPIQPEPAHARPPQDRGSPASEDCGGEGGPGCGRATQ